MTRRDPRTSLPTPRYCLGTGLALALSACLLWAGPARPARAAGARSYPPVLPDARAEIYKTVGQTNLRLYIFTPKNHAATNRRPAIVFFFGGGWRAGSPKQFEKHCQYFASRGMVAITADYRVGSRQGAKPVQCVADAKSAIRWVRQNAARLGVDPNRIVASGGSAGGHIAACTAVVPDLDEPGEDTSVSAVPDAAVLFNPVLVLAPLEGMDLEGFASRVNAERMGVDPKRISPAHHVRADAPPTIIFHGKADTTVPFATAEAFRAKMNAAGNRCELVGFADQPHGFFNYGRGNNRFFRQTLTQADEFLTSLGYLSGPPQVDEFLSP
jgi:acetyl esterase